MTKPARDESHQPNSQDHADHHHDSMAAGQHALTVVQISDIHLKPDQSDRIGRFEDIIKMAVAQKPDCIVLSGDLTEDGFDWIEDLEWAKPFVDSINVPFFMIPGNHDVGDKSGQGPNSINATRLANWNNIFGSDHFVHDIGPWRLIGINSLLVASHLPEENLQLIWLDQMLDQAQRLGQHVALFMHEPPFIGTPGKSLGGKSDYWSIAPDKQHLYMKRLTRSCVKLVASGHVHWYNSFLHLKVPHVWCPSTSFIVDDSNFPRGGNCTGLLVHKLADNGVAAHTLMKYERPDTQIVNFNPA